MVRQGGRDATRTKSIRYRFPEWVTRPTSTSAGRSGICVFGDRPLGDYAGSSTGGLARVPEISYKDGDDEYRREMIEEFH